MHLCRYYFPITILFFFISFTHSKLPAEDTKVDWFPNALFNMEEGDALILSRAKGDPGPGMFSTLSSVLGALELYDSGNFSSLKINFDGGIYFDPERGPNWWEYFFEPIEAKNDNGQQNIYMFSSYEMDAFAISSFAISKIRKFELLQKYVHIKDHILAELKEFFNHHFKDYYVIGIHHRGTDKITEWGCVDYEVSYKTLCTIIENLPVSEKNRLKIYVATDDQNFLNYMDERFRYQIIYSEHVRAIDDNPLHLSSTVYTSNYQKGKEALMDCLLLSKCQTLIYPQSNLSYFSTYFSPNMPSILLTPPGYADKEKLVIEISRAALEKYSTKTYWSDP